MPISERDDSLIEDAPDASPLAISKFLSNDKLFFRHIADYIDKVRLKALVGRGAAAAILASLLVLLDDRRHTQLSKRGILRGVSHAFLAARLGCCVRTIQRGIIRLEEAGLLVTLKHGFPGKGASDYQLPFQAVFALCRPSLFSNARQSVRREHQTGPTKIPSSGTVGGHFGRKEGGRRFSVKDSQNGSRRIRFPKKDPSQWNRRGKVRSQPIAPDAHLKEPAPRPPADLSDDLLAIQDACEDVVGCHRLDDPRNADSLRFIQRLLDDGAPVKNIISRIRRQQLLMEEPMNYYTPAVNGTLEVYLAERKHREKVKRDQDVRAFEAQQPKKDRARPEDVAAVFSRYRKVSVEPVAVKTETRAVSQDVYDLVNAEKERRARGDR